MNKVVEDILRRGEERKQEIIRQGEEERDQQIVQADKRIQEDRAKAEKKLESSIALMEHQEVSSVELESKKMLLAAQRQAMEELREQVLAELATYPSDKRKKLYSKLVAKAKKELGDCSVYSRKEDKTLLQLPAGMPYAGTIECVGGLVFESRDKSVRLDYRFESLLEDVWNKDMQEIFAKLFR